MNQPPYGYANLPPPSPYAPPPMVPPATAQPPPPQVATLSATPPPAAPPPPTANSPYGGVASSGAAGGLTAPPVAGQTVSDTVEPKDTTASDKLAQGVGGAVSGFGASMQKTAQAGQADAFNLIFHSSTLPTQASAGPITISDRRAKTQIHQAAAQLRAYLESWRR